MPNRIIKESICSSEKVASLTDFEFRLWVCLITQADDAGRGDARPAIIKGHVFPFRDRLSIKDIDVALQALAAKGCVSLYTVDGKPYFWFPGWAKHQRVRDCKPRFPEPPNCGENSGFAATCGESPQTAADCGLNPIQSESNPNPNPIQSGSVEPPRSRGRFAPPSVSDVAAYCAERGNGIDAEAFVAYYESNGWKVGRSAMKDWMAAVRTWEQRQKADGPAPKRKKQNAMQPGADTQPTVSRIQESSDWLDAFLAGRGEANAMDG